MLKGLSEPVRLREKGNGQRAIEGPFYTCIEKIKLGAGQLPFLRERWNGGSTNPSRVSSRI